MVQPRRYFSILVTAVLVVATVGCTYSDSYSSSAEGFEALGKATPSGVQLPKKDPGQVIIVNDAIAPGDDGTAAVNEQPVEEVKPLIVDQKGPQSTSTKAGKNGKKKKKR